MPLFDLNNLEHTSCKGGGCGIPYGPTMILYSPEEDLLAVPQPTKPNPKVIVSKLTRADYLHQPA